MYFYVQISDDIHVYIYVMLLFDCIDYIVTLCFFPAQKELGNPWNSGLFAHLVAFWLALRCKDLEEFLASSAMQLQMPSSINGLERKFLHEQAGWTKTHGTSCNVDATFLPVTKKWI